MYFPNWNIRKMQILILFFFCQIMLTIRLSKTIENKNLNEIEHTQLDECKKIMSRVVNLIYYARYTYGVAGVFILCVLKFLLLLFLSHPGLCTSPEQQRKSLSIEEMY